MSINEILHERLRGTVYHLDSYASAETEDAYGKITFPYEDDPEVFEIGWSGQRGVVLEKVELSGSQVLELVELFSTQLSYRMDPCMSGHGPTIGVDLFGYDQLFFRSSFDFGNGNWIYHFKDSFIRMLLAGNELEAWFGQFNGEGSDKSNKIMQDKP